MEATPSPPSSPWAQRFPVPRYTFIEDNTKHSSLAPQFPRINDPKHYDEDPDKNKNHQPLNNKDIDSVLFNEQIQRTAFWGARTFQLAALNRRLMFSTRNGLVTVPGGHRRSLADKFMAVLHISSPLRNGKKRRSPSLEGSNDFQIYERERIKVNEKKWFPFLKKEKWFDWIQFSPDVRRSKPKKTWTVDDAKLWSILSVSLELTNYFLRALIDDNHIGLRTILYGRIDYWRDFKDIFGEPPSKNASVLLSHSMERLISNRRATPDPPFDLAVTQSAGQTEIRLNTLLSTIVWGFQEHFECHAVTNYNPSVGDKKEPYSSIITIDTLKLESLLNPDLALGELCQKQVDLAITIVHELMHAILGARSCDDDNYIGNVSNKKGSGKMPREPYLDGEGFAEAGYYMEQSFFGGVSELEPRMTDMASPPPLVQGLRKWPHADFNFTPASKHKAFLQDGALDIIYHVPLTWPSKLLSEAFWRDPAFMRKSDNFFHNSRIFVTRAPIKRRRTGQYTTPEVMRDPNPPGQQYHYLENKKVADDWTLQTKHWGKLRAPWYQKAFREWEASPWSGTVQRRTITEFAEAFERKDHIQCANLVANFISKVDWTRDHATFKRYMPTEDEASSYWIWHAIGLLMAASIPILKQKLVQSKPSFDWQNELTPSKEAAAAGYEMTIYISPVIEPDQDLGARPSRLYDQTKPNKGKVDDFDQIEYLELIDGTIDLIIELKGRVHRKLLNAICEARNAIHEDREKLMANYPGKAHTTKWASSWVFEFPEYNPTVCQYINNRWRNKKMDFGSQSGSGGSGGSG